MKNVIVLVAYLCISITALAQQPGRTFTEEEKQKVLKASSGISGPGKPVQGNGWGGWRSGYEGVMYSGTDPLPRYLPMAESMTSGSVIKNGLLPNIKPSWEVHIRDAVVILGGDGNYYMTGSSGENIWKHADGVELWKSKDLKKWDYIGLVWTIEKDGRWEKNWASLRDQPVRALWAPELHYLKGNYYICLSMPPGGVSILKSTSGKPEGPYVHTYANPDKPFVGGIDPTFFQDDDGKVYFTWASATRIALMKDDMSGFEGEPYQIKLENPDHTPEHHAEKCRGRGMNDLGHEGAVLFKANGKYYLGAADNYQGRYSTCLAIADHIKGPYTMRHESVPSAGGTNFFKDKQGNWWSSYFGNDSQSPWREKPGLIRVDFAADGKVIIAKNQPFAVSN